MKRHSLLSMVFLLGIILIGLVGIPGRADAAGISGRLVNKTPKGKGVEGAEVTLTAYRNEQEAGKTPTRTDRAGRFQFQDLSAKPGDTYTVTVRYQDAEYNSERIVLQDAGATRTLEIPVYDSTTDASQISVKIHHVVFSVADGSLRAEEVLLFRNSGDKAYVGAKEVAGGRRATLQFSLPAGAREVKYGEGLMECCVVPGEQGFVDTMDVNASHLVLTGGQVPGTLNTFVTASTSVAISQTALTRRCCDWEVPQSLRPCSSGKRPVMMVVQTTGENIGMRDWSTPRTPCS